MFHLTCKPKMATKIIVSVSEECTFQIKTYVGDRESIANVAFCAIHEQVIDNCPWIRETLLTDVRSFDERYDTAKLISNMVKLFNSELEIAQVIFHKDGESEYKKIAGESNFERAQIKDGFLCFYENDVVILDRKSFPNPSTDVSHIKQNFEFHSNKHTANPLTFCPENLFNKSDMVTFVGDCPQSIIDTFEKFNELNNDYCIVKSLDEYKEKVLDLEEGDDEEKLFRCALVVDIFSVNLAIDIIREKPEKIGIVVCDTMAVQDKEARNILSLCHSKGIMCVRKAQRHGLFNFGVISKDQQCRDSFHTGNGVITMTNDTVVKEYLYVIFIDPRMAQIARAVLALEMSSEIWCITMIQDAYDHVVSSHHDYKFFPIIQTEGINRIAQMTKKHSIHTAIAVITPFPNVAITLFENGIFSAYDRECLLEYVDNVNRVFDEHVKDVQKKNVSRVVSLKAEAYNSVTEIEKKAKKINAEIGPAVARRVKRLVNNEIVTHKVKGYKNEILKELKTLTI